jgi:hypothetical protein
MPHLEISRDTHHINLAKELDLLTSLNASQKQHYIIVYESWLKDIKDFFPERSLLPALDIHTLDYPADAASLLFIGPPGFSEPSQVIALRQRLDLPIGMLTGSQPDTIVQRLCQLPPVAPGQDILIDRITPGTVREEEGCTLYPEGSLQDERATLAVLAEEVRLLAVTTHGRGDAIYLPHVMLCGRQGEHVLTGEYRLPACVYDGDCFYRGRSRFLAHQVRTRVLFLNSCASLSGQNGLFAEKFALDAAVTSGTEVSHLIGSPLVRYGEPAQARFLSLLLNQGLAIGQAITLLDDAITYRSLDIATLLLYGDPAAIFSPTSAGNVLYVDPMSQSCEVPSGTALLVFTCQPAKGNFLVLAGPAALTTYPTRAGFFAFANAQHIPPGTYRWRYVDVADFSKRIQQQALEPLQRFKQLRLFDIHPHKMSGRLLDLENRSLQLRDGLRALIVENTLQKLDKPLQQVARTVKQIDEAVLDALIAKASHSMYHLVEVYRQECQLVVEQSELLSCPYCQQIVNCLLWQHPVDVTFKRRVVLCPRCGYVADQPAESSASATFCLATPALKKGRTSTITLEFQGVMAPSVLACVLVDTYRFDTPPVFIRQDIDENQLSCQFSLGIPASLPSHNFWLATYMVSNGMVSTWGTNIWIRP